MDGTFVSKQTVTFNVLIADGHPVVRAGLIAIIDREPDMRVIADASNGREAMDKFFAQKPDVGLFDLRLLAMDGVQVVSTICNKEPSANLIIISLSDTEEDVYRAVRAGAKGYLLKQASSEEIIECIRAIAGGRTWIRGSVASKLAARIAEKELTNRELEVLRAVANGKSNKEVAGKFDITEATVKVHVTHILEKLKVSSRTEAICSAVKRGIIRIDTAA